MCDGGCGNPSKPSASGATAPCRKATGESKTSGNRIDIVFDPDKSSKVKKCNKIVHVQFIKIFVDGKLTKPGSLLSGWAYRDKVVAKSGWWIDHLSHEKTPDYQQGSGDGKKNGGSAKAKITDIPNIGNDTIRKRYDPKTNPGGWKEIKYIFETYAYCMKGDDCGKWYEGVKWEYKKTWQEHRDGKKGVSKITDQQVSGPPAAELLQAFDKFNKEKKHKPCK